MVRTSGFAILVLAALALLVAGPAQADSMDLHVDSAPNVYGSPDWAPWWADTKDDVVAGTMTNMRSGTYPGTLTMDPYDEIVYSTGDLGQRLHWIYWVPGKSTADLDGLFEVKWVIDWGGNDWTYEGGAWAADGADVGWSQPGSWEDYSGGTIGSLGFAWWASDDDAPPLDSYGNPYDETDQADIDALRLDIFAAQTYATGLIRYRATENDEWEYCSIRVDVVPEPMTLSLFGLGLGGLLLARRRRS